MSVEQVLSGLQRAWNAGDASAFAEHFGVVADFVDVVGRHQRGRAEIARQHRWIFDTLYRNSTVEFQLLDEREVAPGVVLAHTTSTLRVPAGPRAGETRSIQTVVVQDGSITAFHNTIRADFDEFARGGA
ncbi:SgcJ/EcaC family oxidoreductase [Saccharopolyspora hirsuta]|uniref:SgcJ/EcaC family oxidoreductase n=1 Tax=Saccharopolyspora hirsuta TaxID=1837 RepID=UPI003332D8C4